MPFIDDAQDDPVLFKEFRYVDQSGSFPEDTWPEDEVLYFYSAKSPEIEHRWTALQEKYGKDTPGVWAHTLIVALGHHWTRRLPETFKRRTKKGDVIPHELAGQVPPLDYEYVRKLSDAEIGGAIEVALAIISPRDPETQERFRSLTRDISGPRTAIGEAARDVSGDSLVSEGDAADILAEVGH